MINAEQIEFDWNVQYFEPGEQVMFSTRRWEGFGAPSYPATVEKVWPSKSGRIMYLIHLEAKRNGRPCRSLLVQLEDLIPPCKKSGKQGTKIRLIAG